MTRAQRGGRLTASEITFVGVILVCACVMRLANLGTNPPGLFRDEWEKGYTALELWSTGRHAIPSSTGIVISEKFPFFIETFQGGDQTSAIYQYLSAPVVGLFGLTALTARLVAALSGLSMVLVVWIFARRFLSREGGLAALVLLAFHPTGIIFSRWAQQGSLAMLLGITGSWLLCEATESRGKCKLATAIFAALALAVSAYAYDPLRLVVPLIVACFALTHWSNVRSDRAVWIPVTMLFLLLMAPLVFFTVHEGGSRLHRVFGGGMLQTVTNYLEHFSPRFLMLDGDRNARHHLPGLGFMSVACGVLCGFSAVAAVLRIFLNRDEKKRSGLFLWSILLCAPVAAALTNEGIPHALRACMMIPASALVGALGFDWLARVLPRRSWIVLLFAVALWDGLRAHRGLQDLQNSPPAAWQMGIVEEIQDARQSGRPLLISTQIPYVNYAILFGEALDPIAYHEKGLAAAHARLADGLPPPPGGIVTYMRPVHPFSIQESALGVDAIVLEQTENSVAERPAGSKFRSLGLE